jgi:hypothetical protein
MVPAFTMCRSTREMPSFVPAASPRLRRRSSPWPPHRRNSPASELTAHPSQRSRTAPRPISTRLEPVRRLRNVDTGFSRTPSRLACRTRTVWQYRHVPSLSGLFPPSPAPPGSDCPQLQPSCCDSQAAESSHPRSVTSRLAAHRLVDEPPITGYVSARPCRVDQQRSETLHPPIDGHVIHLDAPLGQQLFHISIRQPVAQIPTTAPSARGPHQRNETQPSWISTEVPDGNDDASAQPG